MTTTLEALARTPMSEALGWALYHSMWQCAAVALLLLLALFGIRSSRIRYALACVALMAALVGFVFTFNQYLPGPRLAARAAVLEAPFLQSHESGLAPAALRAGNFLPWLAPIWIAGVILFQLRGFFGWIAAQRMRKLGVCLAPDDWQKRVSNLSLRLREIGRAHV